MISISVEDKGLETNFQATVKQIAYISVLMAKKSVVTCTDFNATKCYRAPLLNEWVRRDSAFGLAAWTEISGLNRAFSEIIRGFSNLNTVSFLLAAQLVNDLNETGMGH
jgi:hypothetical protein